MFNYKEVRVAIIMQLNIAVPENFLKGDISNIDLVVTSYVTSFPRDSMCWGFWPHHWASASTRIRFVLCWIQWGHLLGQLDPGVLLCCFHVWLGVWYSILWRRWKIYVPTRLYRRDITYSIFCPIIVRFWLLKEVITPYRIRQFVIPSMICRPIKW